MTIPHGLNYDGLPSLSTEVKVKLKRVLPMTIGQASRIPGVTPAAIIALIAYIKKGGHTNVDKACA